ncbi:MAG: PIN domain-containing protein, partial [Deltaproteobacteria bacterium]
MRALIDTNILIHREAPVPVHQDIGLVFNWLDRLGYEKCVHSVSIGEIQRHEDERVRRSFKTKLESYRLIKVPSPFAPEVKALSEQFDSTENDLNDSTIINELFTDRVDLLITEDRNLVRKAERLHIGDRVFTIDGFLEKVTAENPELVDYRVLSVKKTLFGEVDVNAPFFDSLRIDYPGFGKWFNRKSEELAYICMEGGKLVGFLYLKVEDWREPYPDIVPYFRPKKRLKVGTLKVDLNGFKIGERFLKIIFDNAIKQRVEEIYVTIFHHRVEEERLINLLEDFGFNHHGEKRNNYGIERVYVRDMTPRFNGVDPKLTFPFISKATRFFLVPIYPEYHTELLPDSILRTESPTEFIEQEPHRNAIQKVYVSRSYFRDLHTGDVIVFYRTGGYHRSVVTTLGIIEAAHLDIPDEDQFIRLCRKRSVFSDNDLRAQWRHSPSNRPFIVDFLYAYSLPQRPNMASLIEQGVIRDVDSAPRGFERISIEKFETILKLSNSDTR